MKISALISTILLLTTLATIQMNAQDTIWVNYKELFFHMPMDIFPFSPDERLQMSDFLDQNEKGYFTKGNVSFNSAHRNRRYQQ